jgi:hypothetical protein
VADPGAIILYALAIVYLLAFVPRSMRRIQFESTIVVRCTPKAAFALVSDPNNWHRYVPELELRAAVRAPVTVGDLIYDRVVVKGSTHDAIERVIAYEPGERFGTQIVGGHGTTGIYELYAADGGTLVTYRCQATLTLFEAWAGNGFRRGRLAAKLKEVRDPIMQRIKAILEAEAAAVSV